MPKYLVHLRPLVTVEVTDSDPESAARYARDRAIGVFRDYTPAEIQSFGYLPDYPWQVVDSGGALVAEGVDNDLFPRQVERRT